MSSLLRGAHNLTVLKFADWWSRQQEQNATFLKIFCPQDYIQPPIDPLTLRYRKIADNKSKFKSRCENMRPKKEFMHVSILFYSIL